MTNSARLRCMLLFGCLSGLLAIPCVADEPVTESSETAKDENATPDPYAPYGGYLALFGYRNPAQPPARPPATAAVPPAAAYPAGTSVAYYPPPALMPPAPIVSYYAVERPVGYYLPPPLPHVHYAKGRYKLTPNGIKDIRVRYWWDDGRYTIDPSHRDFLEFYH